MGIRDRAAAVLTLLSLIYLGGLAALLCVEMCIRDRIGTHAGPGACGIAFFATEPFPGEPE